MTKAKVLSFEGVVDPKTDLHASPSVVSYQRTRQMLSLCFERPHQSSDFQDFEFCSRPKQESRMRARDVGQIELQLFEVDASFAEDLIKVALMLHRSVGTSSQRKFRELDPMHFDA